jgi:ankyrin repeat protein
MAQTIEERLFEAARNGDAAALSTMLDAYPERLLAREPPYQWSLLHAGAKHLAIVDLLLNRGLDVNTREEGDNSYAMHWAAAAGALDVVRRLADAGGDVIGHGDDHQLEVIGWATCWDECDDEAHRDVAEFLISRGARHHLFSAISMNLADHVRDIVKADSTALNRRMSRNENHQTALHFAVRMNRPSMVTLLLELGADPLAVDGGGQPVAAYADAPDTDRAVMERIRAMLEAELVSAARGHRQPHGTPRDLLAALSLGDWEAAERLVGGNSDLMASAGGALHLMVKRNDRAAIRWLLDRGADPNGRWAHWDAVVTPLHLAVMAGHEEVARMLLDAGANPGIRDSKHDSDPIGWAEFFERPRLVQMLKGHQGRA